MRRVKAFVIAPENGGRHQILLQQLAEISGLEIEVFPARIVSSFPADYDMDRMRALHNLDLRPAELGCAMSHRDVQRLIAGSSDPWTLVLEDDARISDRTGFERVIEELSHFVPGDPASAVSLYSEGAILKRWPERDFVECVGEPPFAVAYFLTPAAAGRLSEANHDLRYASDWPRRSGVTFFLHRDRVVRHGDEQSVSLVGVRQVDSLRLPTKISSLSVKHVIDRLAIYTFVHYARHRRHFHGLSDYIAQVMRHRLIWHIGRTVFRSRRTASGDFVMSWRPRSSIPAGRP